MNGDMTVRPDDLHSFITLLDQADQLARVTAEVDPYLEAAAIIDRVSKGAAEGRALLFSAIRGAELPVAANLLGSRQRVAWALGTTDLHSLAEKITNDLSPLKNMNGDQALIRLCGVENWQSVDGRHECTVDLTAGGLSRLPLLQFWPQDGGRYITLGQVLTADRAGRQNCGIYRLQQLDAHRLAVQLRPGAGAARHLRAWHAGGKPLPVAITLGGPPALTWAASLPLPAMIDEAHFVGYLTGRPLTMAACRHNDLKVPATAEILIAGEIRPGEVALEGPFGNHTGGYGAATPQPVIRVSGIYARANAIYPTTLVGPPPMENANMAEAACQLLLPLLQHDLPWVRALSMPSPGIQHRGTLLAVDRACDLPLTEIGRHLAQSRLLRNARLLVLFDADSRLDDPAELYWRIINTPDWRARCRVSSGRLLLDARRPGNWLAVVPDRDVRKKVLKRWSEYGLQE
ncbi:MAG: UbiD family decarboxylase [Desulfuromonadales bacterium]|nr:UbiD family decarboxylase [Desulfuromonadales bacterium]